MMWRHFADNCVAVSRLAVVLSFVTRQSGAVPGEGAKSGARPWPSRCAESSVAGQSRRVFLAGTAASDGGCGAVARAMGLLGRDAAHAQSLLDGVDVALQQTPELRWLKGRAALALGQAQAAFVALRPDSELWPQEPYTLWDLAIAAATVGEESVARQAYRRLIQSELMGERVRIAMLLELAALESRRGAEGVSEAAIVMAQIAWTETDPDTCPWVSVMQRYLEQLQPTRPASWRSRCSSETTWSRLLQSNDGSAAAFAAVPRSDSWLRLPRNERLSLAALGLGSSSPTLRQRLWGAVEAPQGSALSALQRRELSRLKALAVPASGS